MATDQEQPDEREDAELASLLDPLAGAPAPREEFVRALSERLDRAFAEAERPSPVAVLLTPSTNGAAQRAGSSGQVVPPLASAAVEVAPTGRRRRLRSWTIGAVVAASLMVAMVVWGPAYGWTVAIRAWVFAIVQSTGGPRDVSSTTQDNGASPDAVASVMDAEKESPVWAPFDDPLPVEALSRRVDDLLADLWQSQGIAAVGPATDGEFMRRVYLDLTGRTPSVSEVHEFLNDQAADRRERLVDRLLAHRDHATHLAAVWRRILLPDGIDLSRYGGSIEFERWLAERFAANKPYDRIVRDLLLAEGRVSESGPMLFYAALRLNPEELAGKTSRAFLGVRMECAQCHDHPFDDESQQDFWSFAAFFARISRPKGRMEMTSPVLAVRDNEQGDVTIPDSDEVVPPRLPLSEVEVEDVAGGPPRRQYLADWLTSTSNGQFARATVNRVWSQLFGRGLVEPVDDMRPANPPLAPEVLDVLSRDFAASQFDLRRLFRALVLTKSYQLSSRSEENDPSRAMFFAQMNVKSFTAEQLYDCIAIATRQGAVAAAATDGAAIERFADTNRQAFIDQFRAPPGQLTDYQAGIPQALTLMHGGLIHGATDMATSGLLQSLSAPFFTDEQRLDTMFLSTLSRYPAPAERELMLRQVAQAKTDDERQQVLGDVLWALLNSGEFTFNH